MYYTYIHVHRTKNSNVILHYGFYCCCFYQITDTVSKVNLKEALFCVDSELSSPSLTSSLSSLVTTVQQVVVKVVCYIYC